MSNLALVPTWEPWNKVMKFIGTHGRFVAGPYAISVWHKTNLVNLTLHNHTGTWSTWLDLTPDEALRVAQNLISAARKAQETVLSE